MMFGLRSSYYIKLYCHLKALISLGVVRSRDNRDSCSYSYRIVLQAKYILISEGGYPSAVATDSGQGN